MTKVQVFVDMMDATTESITVSSENVVVIQNLAYLDCLPVIRSFTNCKQEDNRRQVRALRAIDSLDEGM